MFFSLFCFCQILTVLRPSQWGHVCPLSEFQNLSFCVLRSKPCRFWYLLLYLCFSPLLLQFQPIFLLFVAISTFLCCCFKAMSLVGIFQQGLYPVFPPFSFQFLNCSFPGILLPLVNIRYSCISNRLGFKNWHIPRIKKIQ